MTSNKKIKALNEVLQFVVHAELKLKNDLLIYFSYNSSNECITLYIHATFEGLSVKVIDSYSIDIGKDKYSLSYKKFEFKLKEIITDIESKYLTK